MHGLQILGTSVLVRLSLHSPFKQEKSFTAHQILSECRVSFCGIHFIRMEFAKGSHRSIEHLSKNFHDLLKTPSLI